MKQPKNTTYKDLVSGIIVSFAGNHQILKFPEKDFNRLHEVQAKVMNN